MIPLTHAIKVSGYTKPELMKLVIDGRIGYATNDNQSAFIVNLDDITYHKRQLMYNSLTHTQLKEVVLNRLKDISNKSATLQPLPEYKDTMGKNLPMFLRLYDSIRAAKSLKAGHKSKAIAVLFNAYQTGKSLVALERLLFSYDDLWYMYDVIKPAKVKNEAIVIGGYRKEVLRYEEHLLMVEHIEVVATNKLANKLEGLE